MASKLFNFFTLLARICLMKSLRQTLQNTFWTIPWTLKNNIRQENYDT